MRVAYKGLGDCSSCSGWVWVVEQVGNKGVAYNGPGGCLSDPGWVWEVVQEVLVVHRAVMVVVVKRWLTSQLGSLVPLH